MATPVAPGQLALPIDPDSRYEADVRRVTSRIALAVGVMGVTEDDFRCRWSCREWARITLRIGGAVHRIEVTGAEGGSAELGVLEILVQELDALALRVQNGEPLAQALAPWRVKGSVDHG